MRGPSQWMYLLLENHPMVERQPSSSSSGSSVLCEETEESRSTKPGCCRGLGMCPAPGAGSEGGGLLLLLHRDLALGRGLL